MDLLNLGSQSRKTGLRPRANLTKDKYNMDDIDEFFSDDEKSPTNTLLARRGNGQQRTGSLILGTKEIHSSATGRKSGSYNHSVTPKDNIDNVARMINFTDAEAASFNLSPILLSSKYSAKKKNKKSPLRSPLPERSQSKGKEEFDDFNIDHGMDYYDNNGFDYDEQEDNDEASRDFEDKVLSPVSHSPVTKPKQTIKSSTSKNSGSSLTKSMALGANSKRRRPALIEDSDDDDEETTNEFIEDNSELPSPPPTTKKSVVRRRIQDRVSETVTRPSPLPSPPPDGLRRSKRTRIAPLAFWRGERIVYTRAFESTQDPDTTLANDIKKVPLQEIKEVVHIPDTAGVIANTTKKKTRLRSKLGSKKKELKDSYDYESDPEISGSEWFKDKALTLVVVENDQKTEKLVAVAPNGGDFETPRDVNPGMDNFTIAPLFNQDQEFNATGLIDFPFEGAKLLRDSGDVIYNFHVVKGLIEVNLNNEKFIVTRGCSFQIPSKNTYGFKNIGNCPARLYFVQSRIPNNELDDESW
ncbi:uncharacterized protein CANTADRAFT_23770 [Suhomyces tanzawaensis NRRL Y-17324]|uniref:Mif2/CENP-C cupin domain-containing protein n=1 Tax=Suhomyces tanzawaensis NRRL Y-17324 TaxID=984487 RepID=A0A1E4SDS6_9ASCO|nr:uncharacterized protein CANTADRAFT_23770 [Suhomyces tanzawaensis NRRL Y-17324]ODV77667.1 hypothetical protein CANTADRAFT_23770 [Suhomyces tanzawaensis NRRL Y-17324]